MEIESLNFIGLEIPRDYKFKKGGAGALAFLLASAMAVTSYSPITAFADDVQNEQIEESTQSEVSEQAEATEHFDTTAPVMDQISLEGADNELKNNDMVTIKLHAYDEGGSGLDRIEVNLNSSDDVNNRYDSAYCSYYINETQDGTEWTVDNDNTYSLKVNLNNLKLGYTYYISSVTAYDAAGNVKYMDNAMLYDNGKAKYSFIMQDKTSEKIAIKSFKITDQNGNNALGQKVEDETLLSYAIELSDNENVDYIQMNWVSENSSGSWNFECYDESGIYSSNMSAYSYAKEDNEYKLKELYIVYKDGSKEKLAFDGLENGLLFTVINGKPYEGTSFDIESIKLYKADGTEVPYADIVTQGETLTIKVITKGVQEKTSYANISMYADSNNVSTSKSVELQQSSADTNCFEGKIVVDNKMYPTSWRVSGMWIDGFSNTVYWDTNVVFIVQTASGDVVIPTLSEFNIDYITWKKYSDSWGTEYQTIKKENVPAYQKLNASDLELPTDVECPIDGGKFTGWHVVRNYYDSETNQDKYEDLGDINDYMIGRYDYSLTVMPTFSKEFYRVSFSYVDKTGIEKYVDDIVEGDFDADKIAAAYTEKYKAEIDPKLGFSGFEADYTNLQSRYVSLKPKTEKRLVKVTYNYINNNNEVAVDSASEYVPSDEVKDDDAIRSKYQAATEKKDDITSEKFDKWEVQYINNWNSGIISLTLNAKYVGKKVIRPDYSFKIDSVTKTLFVDENASDEAISKIVLDNAPSGDELHGVKIADWNLNTGIDGYKNFSYQWLNAKISNTVVRYCIYKYDKETDSYDIVYDNYDICNVGDTINVPKNLGDYKNIKWDFVDYTGNDTKDNFYSDDIKSSYAAKAGVYYFEANINAEDAPNPAPTPDPNPNPDPTPDPVPTPAPVAKPVIKLDETTVNNSVSKVESAIENAKKENASKPAGEKETPKVEIDMGTATVVPVQVLEAAKGSDIDVVLKMNGYSWTINGNDIKSADLKEINLEVEVNANVIPTGIVEKLAGDKPTMQLSLTHNGDFGFKATLNVEVGKENAGKFGNLYYYDSDGKLVFMNAGKIAADGSVDLSFSHASDYVIVIGEDMTPAKATPAVSKPSVKKAVKSGDTNNTMVFGTIMIMGIVLLLVSFARKRRSN